MKRYRNVLRLAVVAGLLVGIIGAFGPAASAAVEANTITEGFHCPIVDLNQVENQPKGSRP